MKLLYPYTLITGGAGFVGTNLAQRFAEQGKMVLLFDNLSRPGVEKNLTWLLKNFPKQVQIIREDIRNEKAVDAAVQGAEAVFHLAAQVAVTTSLTDPIHDFEVNARGTLNILEAIRKRKKKPFLLFTSTNKVLGGLEDVLLEEQGDRYIPTDPSVRKWGIGESRGIDFCSPYGCSKGAADQYVLDYARCFEIPATVFRMSCIYGPHQCGNEDQGWMAHFVKHALAGEFITFYGNGKQVRDALYVEDLVDAFVIAMNNPQKVVGRAFNMGGGPENAVSLLEVVRQIEAIDGRILEVREEQWRPSDQRYYVSDIRQFSQACGWSPKVQVSTGIQKLYEWMADSCPIREGAQYDSGINDNGHCWRGLDL